MHLPHLPAPGTLRKYLKIRYILLGIPRDGRPVLAFSTSVSDPMRRWPRASIAATLTPTPFLPATFTATPFATRRPSHSHRYPFAVSPLRRPPRPAPTLGSLRRTDLSRIDRDSHPGPEFPTATTSSTSPCWEVTCAPVAADLQHRHDHDPHSQPQPKTASLISFPRDFYVYIPGYGMDRINVPGRRHHHQLSVRRVRPVPGYDEIQLRN